MVKKVGIIGYNEGNGHPYSFSGITNGFNEAALRDAGWDVIANYLVKADPKLISLDGMQITHVWCQDDFHTKHIALTGSIPNIAASYEDMAGAVDAVIIARDDYPLHHEMASFFLDKGIPVFVDKPLTLDRTELDYFTPHLKSGLLFSTSGLRFAKELDVIRDGTANIGDVKSVSCGVVNGWAKYGIHMIDAVLGCIDGLETTCLSRISEETTLIETNMSIPVTISCLGPKAPFIKLVFFGSEGEYTVNIRDNFSAFRRTLVNFQTQLETQKPYIAPEKTLNSINTLIAGQEASVGERIKIN